VPQGTALRHRPKGRRKPNRKMTFSIFVNRCGYHNFFQGFKSTDMLE
jgi:hypothetical protein